MPMTDEELKEEMRQDMLQEAYEEAAEARREYLLYEDYDYFADKFSAEFDEAIEAIEELKRLHDMYGHTLEAGDLI